MLDQWQHAELVMITDASIWRVLHPQEKIEEEKPLQAVVQYPFPFQSKESHLTLLKEDGYCYLPALIRPETVDRMLACVQQMRMRGLPPVYCFAYDLFWQLILEIDPILKEILKGEYLIIPNVWTWIVEGGKGSSYFPPHRDLIDEDFIDEEGMPTLFSLWIPLTDVSTFNSCMYVLPASRDPEYPKEAMTWRERWKQEGHRPWKVEDLVNIRALPAPKGSLLGWNAGVMHWGSKPHRKASSRISIGYYFHAPHAKKKHPGLINLKRPLSLQTRMHAIFESLRLYGKSL